MNMIRISRVVRMSIKNLGQYKMRAGLTVLGIIFGVCSVVAMLSVGEGASRQVQDQIQRQGSNNIWIKSEKLPEEQMSGGQTESSRVATYGLFYEDAEHLEGFVPDMESITPLKSLRSTARFIDKQVEVEVIATVPWYPQVTNYGMLAGRFITKKDDETGAPVCVIGARLARNLFTGMDPLGKDMRVGEDAYRIVGVIGDIYSTRDYTNKPLWFLGENQSVYIPLGSYRARNSDKIVQSGSGNMSFEEVELHQIILKIRSQDGVIRAADVVRDVLARRHERKDYNIEVPLQLLEQARETQRLFNIVLGSIAAISLIVGGIGIMNIMLATVSERTREIGIRRALGAHRRDIVQQFLIETLVLSTSGGFIGMALGAIIPKVVTLLTDVPTVLTAGSFIIAFSVSVAVGLIFGIYPARRAAMMDPIEALRHE